MFGLYNIITALLPYINHIFKYINLSVGVFTLKNYFNVYKCSRLSQKCLKRRMLIASPFEILVEHSCLIKHFFSFLFRVNKKE